MAVGQKTEVTAADWSARGQALLLLLSSGRVEKVTRCLVVCNYDTRQARVVACQRRGT